MDKNSPKAPAKPRRNGRETHKTHDNREQPRTTHKGNPDADDQNTTRQRSRGTPRIQDLHGPKKTGHVDHERIPENAAHPNNYRAQAKAETDKTRAEPTSQHRRQTTAQQTPVIARSTTTTANKHA
ncbi:catalase [Kaistia granuli]|uniref:catalase n=1 Tax=Kaistia granuli TaxID=363259 RepID=UPI0012EBF8D0